MHWWINVGWSRCPGHGTVVWKMEHMLVCDFMEKGALSLDKAWSSRKGGWIQGKVHGKGGEIKSSRLAYVPFSYQSAVPGIRASINQRSFVVYTIQCHMHRYHWMKIEQHCKIDPHWCVTNMHMDQPLIKGAVIFTARGVAVEIRKSSPLKFCPPPNYCEVRFCPPRNYDAIWWMFWNKFL